MLANVDGVVKCNHTNKKGWDNSNLGYDRGRNTKPII